MDAPCHLQECLYLGGIVFQLPDDREEAGGVTALERNA